MTTLYEITDAIRQLESVEDQEEFNRQIESLGLQFKEKALQIAKFAKELEADAITIVAEIDRLKSRQAAKIKRCDWLREYLKANMEQNQVTKIEDEIITLAIRKNQPSCTVDDAEAVPQEFKTLEPARWKVDRVAAIKHFKDTGEIVPGCTIEVNKTHLEIK